MFILFIDTIQDAEFFLKNNRITIKPKHLQTTTDNESDLEQNEIGKKRKFVPKKSIKIQKENARKLNANYLTEILKKKIKSDSAKKKANSDSSSGSDSEETNSNIESDKHLTIQKPVQSPKYDNLSITLKSLAASKAKYRNAPKLISKASNNPISPKIISKASKTLTINEPPVAKDKLNSSRSTCNELYFNALTTGATNEPVSKNKVNSSRSTCNEQILKASKAGTTEKLNSKDDNSCRPTCHACNIEIFEDSSTSDPTLLQVILNA